jgi:hypothetical protein
MNNITEVQAQDQTQFSLSMQDWGRLQMVDTLTANFMQRDGLGAKAAYTRAKALMACVSLSPSVNVATGREGGVVVEYRGGALNLVGIFDIGPGSRPTAKVILGKNRLQIRIG